jgi:hypothetical protein
MQGLTYHLSTQQAIACKTDLFLVEFLILRILPHFSGTRRNVQEEAEQKWK